MVKYKLANKILKKAALKNFAIFIYRKIAVLEFLFNKVAAADSNTGVFLLIFQNS